MMKAFLEWLARVLGHDQQYQDIEYRTDMPKPTPPEPPKPTPEAPKPPAPAPEAHIPDWTTQKGAYRATRVMCDDKGLAFEQKEILSACVYQESHFLNRYLSGPKKGMPVKNENVKNGKVWSIDWGIAQVNDTPGWHIGKGLRFPSVQYVVDHPAEAIEWMVDTMKRTGKLQPWSSYTTGAYKAHLRPGSDFRKLQQS